MLQRKDEIGLSVKALKINGLVNQQRSSEQENVQRLSKAIYQWVENKVLGHEASRVGEIRSAWHLK